MEISGNTAQRGQAAAKYPLKFRLIAWAALTLLFCGIGYFVWSAISEGNLLRLAISTGLAVAIGWANYRNVVRAKHR